MIENMLEIKLADDQAFLKIRETLQRMGIANAKTKTICQSCHILQKRQLHYIVHFKELLQLDGRTVDITEEDIERRNDIAKLLQEWNLCTIVKPEQFPSKRENKFRVISYKDATEGGWILNHKYVIGKNKTPNMLE